MACYDSVASGCCNVYVNDMCADACPYVIDPNFLCGKFVSQELPSARHMLSLPPFIPLFSLPLFPFLFFPTVQTCPDLGNTVSGGTVQYSQSLLQGGYPEGTTATVTCNEGYNGGGDITCQSESWSGSLPGCTGKFSYLNIHTQIRYSLLCLLVM